ncbi:MAG TPA: hypothetical protein VFN65_15350 [Solirubrobacteraceae bacterium]|nr:hypothetical protein [Solirubrobacteraceae bacterium]
MAPASPWQRDAGQELELSYVLLADTWGGYVTEATETLLRTARHGAKSRSRY